MNGSNTGNSISSQLPKLHVSIGVALGWNARIAMIAIAKAIPIQDMQPIVYVGCFLGSSAVLLAAFA